LSGPVTGFVLRAPGHPVVYVSGDNADTALVAEIVERIGTIDIAVLFTGAANVGRFGDGDLTLNARTAVEAARALGRRSSFRARRGWHHFTETRERLEREFAYAGLADRLRVPVACGRSGVLAHVTCPAGPSTTAATSRRRCRG
jgi:hypothetical protein